MTTRLAALLVLVLAGARAASGVVERDCALATSDCTIAETARQAHVHVGAAASVTQGPAESALLAAHFNARPRPMRRCSSTRRCGPSRRTPQSGTPSHSPSRPATCVAP